MTTSERPAGTVLAFRDGPDCPWHGPIAWDYAQTLETMGFELGWVHQAQIPGLMSSVSTTAFGSAYDVGDLAHLLEEAVAAMGELLAHAPDDVRSRWQSTYWRIQDVTRGGHATISTEAAA